MYEERRDTFSIKDIILQVLLIVLFVLILVWVFPSKGYIRRLFNRGTNTEETTKIEASADDIDRLASLYNQIFANNIYAMKEAAIGYYTTERLPKSVGDMDKMTLEDMYNKHLLLKLSDKDGNYCDATKSYVSITKYENEYQMKVNLSCGDEEDYIIVYLGCYDYCDSTGVCEKQVSVNPKSNPSVPRSNDNNGTPSNPDSNPTKDDNTPSNPDSNPTKDDDTPSNPDSNPTKDDDTPSNPDSNPTKDDDGDTECSYKEKENITIIYNSIGGSKVDSTTFCSNCDEQSVTMPTPVKEGYSFEGWYTDVSYSTHINITSNQSKDLEKLTFMEMVDIIVDKVNCSRTTTKTTILYAKWSKGTQYMCEYKKTTDGTWGEYGDWSDWSTTKVVESDSVEVETEVRNEITGYTTEERQVGTKTETYVIGYEEQEKITDYEIEKYIAGYKNEKYISDYVEKKVFTGYKEEQTLAGYKTEKYIAGYKTEKYISGQQTKTEIVGYKQETKKTGYKVEKYIKDYVTKKVKVGTEKVQSGTTTKTTIVKVPAGTTKVYVQTSTGTSVPANTSERFYEVISTKTEETCSGCVTKTLYTWREYKLVTVYKSETRTETVPVYKTVDVYEEQKVPVYGSKKVDVYTTVNVPIKETKTYDVYSVKKIPVYGVRQVEVYNTIKTPIYEVKQVPVYSVREVPVYGTRKTPIYTVEKVEVYGTREVPVYEEIEVPVYGDVTYYRYRSREYNDGTIETRWSTCDPVDESLIEDGFTLTDNKKEV